MLEYKELNIYDRAFKQIHPHIYIYIYYIYIYMCVCVCVCVCVCDYVCYPGFYAYIMHIASVIRIKNASLTLLCIIIYIFFFRHFCIRKGSEVKFPFSHIKLFTTMKVTEISSKYLRILHILFINYVYRPYRH